MIRVVNWLEILPKFEPSINLSSDVAYESKLLEDGTSIMVSVGNALGIIQKYQDGVLVRHVTGRNLKEALVIVQEYFQCPIYCHAEGSRARLYKQLGFKEVGDGRYCYS